MNDFVELGKEDYETLLPIDVAAFHYSGLGACERPGVIRIITRDKRKYEIDYTELPREIVFSICPPFAAICQAAANDYPLPVGWMRLNMGLGNSLYMTSELRQKLLYFILVPDMVKRRDFKASRMLSRLTVYLTCRSGRMFTILFNLHRHILNISFW